MSNRRREWKDSSRQLTPLAKENVLARKLAEETLIYDLETHTAHSLNKTAALVWQLCDGQTSIAQMISTLQKKARVAADEKVVWLALKQLEKAQLLVEPIAGPIQPMLERREVMRKIGWLALPLVTSILVPTPAQAITCFPVGHACGNDAQCCSGRCLQPGGV